MMRYDKTLLAALLRQFATLVPDQPIALETLLPNGTDSYLENVRAASDSSSRWMFLTNYYFWKHPESQSEIQVKAFFCAVRATGRDPAASRTPRLLRPRTRRLRCRDAV